MASNANGLSGFGSGEQPSVYALVTYIPSPLGRFLDDLRLELAPACTPHAHVSLLPPRPIDAAWQVASQHAGRLLVQAEPFEIQFTHPAIFPVTGVIYLEVGDGQERLRRLHALLNAGAMAFDEPFPYHPHSTLAQEVAPGRAQELYRLALRHWDHYRGPRRFLADHAVLVQNLQGNSWIDLATLALGRVPAKS